MPGKYSDNDYCPFSPETPSPLRTPVAKFHAKVSIPKEKLFVAESVMQNAVLAERERCAKIAEAHQCAEPGGSCCCDQEIAAAIRSGKSDRETQQGLQQIRRGPETGESTAPKPRPEAND